ncbi:MAG: hypothetical protein UV63_C0014G0001 [Microgenomates group bacterium GW2011_GWC1_43_11]|uniref:Uncharacterized protein n=2 Tax=Candidatus Gottesmaniibacteriota TaxID=1752720 RepID=A0A0G1IDT3_9BACT|nr:MAG: hypothetical protein UV63_C0014G0001 [Microgenomates group bacterium GW2011_GWC1_43_11]KKT35165.1 MAG: hypothetical protein UW22_C0058G0011 [Candidatus Gottesmanbacteria bacterium GW2011_GWB1_44_11c]KKT57380.1 MAG: hypothetical protein UW52_C0068G0011 [Candidatus Gottesmanbacteria bacterium GW2011_GWA1_44_24b]HCM81942.1 hypothetical protein [Patescibacteria group bacterium]
MGTKGKEGDQLTIHTGDNLGYVKWGDYTMTPQTAVRLNGDEEAWNAARQLVHQSVEHHTVQETAVRVVTGGGARARVAFEELRPTPHTIVTKMHIVGHSPTDEGYVSAHVGYTRDQVTQLATQHAFNQKPEGIFATLLQDVKTALFGDSLSTRFIGNPHVPMTSGERASTKNAERIDDWREEQDGKIRRAVEQRGGVFDDTPYHGNEVFGSVAAAMHAPAYDEGHARGFAGGRTGGGIGEAIGRVSATVIDVRADMRDGLTAQDHLDCYDRRGERHDGREADLLYAHEVGGIRTYLNGELTGIDFGDGTVVEY